MSATTCPLLFTHNLGYPRIGVHRELKLALESYWSGKSTLQELQHAACEVRKYHWKQQAQVGKLNLIPVGDFAWYDHVLEWTTTIGCIPRRFLLNAKESEHASMDPSSDFHLDTLFRMARGRAPTGKPTAACEMTKWFDTNYHFITPEIEPSQEFQLIRTSLFEQVKEAQEVIGLDRVKVVLVGPLTWLYLAKGVEFTNGADDSKKLHTVLSKLLPIYQQVLKQLSEMGVKWVQIDEPILVMDLNEEWQQAFVKTYSQDLVASQQGFACKILLATYFGPLLNNVKTCVQLHVDAVHLDGVRSGHQQQEHLENFLSELTRFEKTHPEIKKKIISLGLVDGRNVWKTDLEKCVQTIKSVVNHSEFGLSHERVWIAPSCSLLHVPLDLSFETKLDDELKSWLAFAVQKLEELYLLSHSLMINDDHSTTCSTTGELESVKELFLENSKCIESRRKSERTCNPKVREKLNIEFNLNRSHSFPERKKAQQELFNLNFLFPTTTIGSFPQTDEIRSIRRKFKNGTVSEEDYHLFLKKEIEKVIRLQEEIGLDVLVHGEPERNDMVEYFGEQLRGYDSTQNGWVQSFGTRCVKPPLLYGDISRETPMTVFWSSYAQSLTQKPVKGMLTGPVTMLNWSFVRDDQPRSVTCQQLAIALREEVQDLENAGIKIIQIDEPALREGLPIRKHDWNEYLKWAVNCFKLSTSCVNIDTQIHTHMCYSEFNDIIQSISDLDADVISIETSRSNMELLQAFEKFNYPNDIAPGVYDIHSPNIPDKEWMIELIKKAIVYIPKENLWINPDCGLKTRGYTEVKQALQLMVQAAQYLRQEYSQE